MFGIKKFECHIMPGRFALNYSGDIGHKTFKGEVSDREISKIRKKLSQILKDPQYQIEQDPSVSQKKRITPNPNDKNLKELLIDGQNLTAKSSAALDGPAVELIDFIVKLCRAKAKI
jgi:hypothetical protein